jgi:S-adenosylmethionine hydrolase
MKTICILTDFGTRDGYPSAMKGVIYSINPDVVITDITHEVGPQNVLEGALTLSRVTPYYPPGVIFVAVVDPGVGTQRRPIAARIGRHFFVGPDNGLFSLHIQAARAGGQPVDVVHLNRPQYHLPEVSNVFHGRDIFAPAAAHLSTGVALEEIGTPVLDPVLLEIAEPQATPHGLRGVVMHVDSFGNLGTNIMREHLPRERTVRVRIAGQTIPHLVRTFGDGPVGSLVALIDSSNELAVAVVNGSAAATLGAQAGDPVEVDWE